MKPLEFGAPSPKVAEYSSLWQRHKAKACLEVCHYCQSAFKEGRSAKRWIVQNIAPAGKLDHKFTPYRRPT